jgi:hypothetical protein
MIKLSDGIAIEGKNKVLSMPDCRVTICGDVQYRLLRYIDINTDNYRVFFIRATNKYLT